MSAAQKSGPHASTSAPRRARTAASVPAASAVGRSALFRKNTTGTSFCRSSRQTVSVWACTPSTQLTTNTAQSTAQMLRSISPLKSAWPGVSIKRNGSPQAVNAASSANTVMPRLRSMTSRSRQVSPLSTRPARRSVPPRYKSCSESVVLPAST